MRYGVEHKEQSRERILESARELFRRRGFEGASIDEVMNAAGLTRGAFYAHFDSKSDLVSQVLDIEAGLVRTLRLAPSVDDPLAELLTALSDYLDPAQRVNVATGCPLVAHPVDAVRGDASRKDGYTAQLKALINSVHSVVGGDDSSGDAILVSVLAIGAGLLSAASSDPQLSDRIDEVCLEKIRDIVSLHAPA